MTAPRGYPTDTAYDYIILDGKKFPILPPLFPIPLTRWQRFKRWLQWQ